jgi:hypothetical protein
VGTCESKTTRLLSELLVGEEEADEPSSTDFQPRADTFDGDVIVELSGKSRGLASITTAPFQQAATSNGCSFLTASWVILS